MTDFKTSARGVLIRKNGQILCAVPVSDFLSGSLCSVQSATASIKNWLLHVFPWSPVLVLQCTWWIDERCSRSTNQLRQLCHYHSAGQTCVMEFWSQAAFHLPQNFGSGIWEWHHTQVNCAPVQQVRKPGGIAVLSHSSRACNTRWKHLGVYTENQSGSKDIN